MPALRKTTATYGIDLTVTQFLKLEAWEEKNGTWPSVINQRLEEIEGVRVIEMNGHFGASIFISVEAENDTPDTHAQIILATKDMIRQSRHMRV